MGAGGDTRLPASHCWRDNHFGRRIVTLDTHYFTISRRYKCGACADAAAALKKAAKAAAQAAGLEVVADEAEAAAADEEGVRLGCAHFRVGVC